MVQVIAISDSFRKEDPALARVLIADTEYVLRWCSQAAGVPKVIRGLSNRALTQRSVASVPSHWPISRDGLLVLPGMSVRLVADGSLRMVERIEVADNDEDCPGGFLLSGDGFCVAVGNVNVVCDDDDDDGRPEVVELTE